MVENSWKLYGKRVRQKKKDVWKMNISSEVAELLTELIQNSEVQLVQQTLAEATIKVTGRGYYQYFVNAIKRSPTTIDETISQMGNDPDLSVHKNEMVLFVSLRCFIDSSFFLFGRKTVTRDRQ